MFRLQLATRWKVGLSIGFLVLAGVIAFGADKIWPLLMLRAFAIPMQWGFAVFAVVLFLLRHWVLSAGVAVAAIAAWQISIFAGPAIAIPNPCFSGLRLVQMNVLQPNTDHEGAIQAALAENPDVICFQEVDQTWTEALVKALTTKYPYRCLAPRDDLYGMALFSRFPLEGAAVQMLGPMPAIEARVQCGGMTVRLIAARLRAPESLFRLQERNAQWIRLAEWTMEDTLPTAVFGDLNTATWDDAFQAYTTTTGMKDITSNAPTWPAFQGHALVPLDHVLLSGKLGTTGSGTFTIPGSDHLGLSTTICFAWE
ncbi:MAG: endonuclease/exonuclease/phosphatase family protein [Flavobacteriales bacterium]|jgi:endonuclease/exonuclease/phosphatase (EEP) superfamily protein YafD|nr:endonuclease/exonuclease/phosphatase family protein [Flavobacteriales bacterium]